MSNARPPSNTGVLPSKRSRRVAKSRKGPNEIAPSSIGKLPTGRHSVTGERVPSVAGWLPLWPDCQVSILPGDHEAVRGRHIVVTRHLRMPPWLRMPASERLPRTLSPCARPSSSNGAAWRSAASCTFVVAISTPRISPLSGPSRNAPSYRARRPATPVVGQPMQSSLEKVCTPDEKSVSARTLSDAKWCSRLDGSDGVIRVADQPRAAAASSR